MSSASPKPLSNPGQVNTSGMMMSFQEANDKITKLRRQHGSFINNSDLNQADHAYLSILQEILLSGDIKEDRTGTGTISIFGCQRRYDLREGFPLLTTKKVLFKGILRELLWLLKGSTNINDDLTQHTPIWDAWADQNGDLGPVYGYQWRHWEKFSADQDGHYQKSHIDQLQQAIQTIKTNPASRRIIVSAWNVADLPEMRLPPCHILYQFNVCGQFLDLQLYQRSADLPLGVPFNIASYSTLLTIIAKECNLTPRYFIHTLGDAHIYLNQVDGVLEQLGRTSFPLPQLQVADKSFDELQFEDFQILNYQHHPFIKFPVAV